MKEAGFYKTVFYNNINKTNKSYADPSSIIYSQRQ